VPIVLAPPPAPPAGGGTAALFTLLGVGITAAVSLVAILLKHVLDSRTEARRHARQLELDDREHARNLDRMRLELAERRADAAEGQQVQAMAKFLAESLAIYTQITMIRQSWERDRDDAKCRDALLSISPADAQMAFEEVRLLASESVTEKADRLWQHLRGQDVPRGRRFDREDWTAWKDGHWALRKALISQGQAELRGQ
jgi:hypothetical protein